MSVEPESNPAATNDIGIDPEAAVALLHQLKDEGQLPEIAERTIIAALSESYAGPLPHPRHLKAYEDVVPGAARDILNMAMGEQKHRHRLQMMETAYPYLGWLAGFVGFLVCVSGAIYLGINHQTAVALGLVGVPSVGAIGWFIRARIVQSDPE
ncbi:MAG: DUF2335 domain-containing protein [Acidiphilium sp.]|nr:DUF2335 domain-containing protein [Acidiphilium sp.]MDD4934609.1 DUF2335 domain-containing protein [Acidiphilium sp.]